MNNQSNNPVLNHALREMAGAFNFDSNGCTVAFYDSLVQQQELTSAISILAERGMNAIPVYEDGELDFLFVHPRSATDLRHPRRALDSNCPGKDRFLTVTDDEINRLAKSMLEFGWTVSDSEDSFSLSKV